MMCTVECLQSLSENFEKHQSGKEFSDPQKETMDIVIEHYADTSPQWLSDQTH